MGLLLISLDGLWEGDFEYLQSLPTIGHLIKTGTSCKRVQSIYPGLTYPIHTTILTGVKTNKHNIPHNHPFMPYLPERLQPWYWDANQIQAPTMHQWLAKRHKKTASILWPVTGKSKYIHYNFPEVLALPGENQTIKMLQYGTAPWILKTELLYGRKRKSTHQPDLDDYATILCESLYSKKRPPDFCTLHLVDCDEMRHLYGRDSIQAKEALNRHDRRINKILQIITKYNKDTIIAIISDHGLWDVDRPIYLDAAIAKAGLYNICQTQATGMGAYVYINPPTEQNIQTIYTFLQIEKEKLGIKHIYTKNQLREMGAIDEISLGIEAMEGVIFKDGLIEEALKDGEDQGLKQKATHGFGPSHPAAKCIFILSGLGIQKGGTIDMMNMEDVAPTLMAAMGEPLSTKEMEGLEGITISQCFESGEMTY